nr:RNA-directed DNA polymerase, eukaryota, reverse transcriptase zinc-binding domain protein [Tanacetum cinerariifolium]
MTNSDTELDNVYDISHLKIKVAHPNRTESFISNIRNLKLPNGLVLFGVLVIPEYRVTLISVHNLAKDNKIFYGIDTNVCNSAHISCLIQHDWHCRLGHHVDPVLNVLKDNLGIKNKSQSEFCETCQRAKKTREHFPLSDHKSSKLGDLIHLDLWGPYKVTSSKGFSNDDIFATKDEQVTTLEDNNNSKGILDQNPDVSTQGHFKKSEVPKSGGSILQLIEDLVKVGETMGYDMKGCMKNMEEIIELQGANDVRRRGGYYGDFNEVCNKSKRFETLFNRHGADLFNRFISNARLEEVPLEGCSFTWCHRFATKMSKLDCFLISDSLLCSCPNISSITLDRYLSDHRPILMREVYYDYGPVLFLFFHYWFEVDGFDKFIEDSWKDAPIIESNALVRMMKKLKYLKEKIRMWNKLNKEKSHKSKRSLLEELADCDAIIDKGLRENNVVNIRTEVVNLLQEVEKKNSLEAAQKAKIKWAIEGDENSKYYHGVINKKRNQLSIRRILVEGTWIDSSSLVKSEFMSHFKNQFEQPNSNRLHMNMLFWNILIYVQVVDLECQVSKEEIKKAVCDCWIDKSPCPDGFTFGFYRRYWKLIENDVVDAVTCFFHQGSFPKGVDVGLFKGIDPTPSLNISHMFYADDAIFMGQWSESNIDTIVKVLDCFNRASGLRINMTKSKLLGIFVEDDKVKQAAAKIGCNTLKTPISYLGSKVGGCMSRIQSWNEMIERMACRLSKWKLKTLSIGGRLTLLKSVLGSMPIYHMSLFKVPNKVLHRMESIRSHFFNGAELSIKKSIWVKWKHALASKDKGGLGVSSLFALNRALMFKWKVKSCYPSLWLDIVHEVEMFKSRGKDLVSLIHSKLGNRANTSFWEVAWHGGSPGGVKIQQFEHMKEKVEGCILADMMDRWFWPLEGSGEFTITPVRKMIDDFMLPEVSSKMRWIKAVPIKLLASFFLIKIRRSKKKFSHWIDAMNSEMDALLRNDTWEIINLPKDRKTIGRKWISKIKYKSSGEIDRYKARLVAQRFGQKELIDYEETFSPASKMVTVRCLLNITVSNSWHVYQLDVNNAIGINVDSCVCPICSTGEDEINHILF